MTGRGCAGIEAMGTARRAIPGRWFRRLGVAVFLCGLVLGTLFLVSARWWFGYGSNTWLADLGDGTLYTQSFEANRWNHPLVGWCGGDNRGGARGAPAHKWSWTWWTWGARKST